MGSKKKATATPSIAGALFGATRQAVLRLLLGHADKRFYQRQIVRELGLGSGTVQRELKQLTKSGILTRSVEGRQAYYQANHRCPVFEELRGLVRKTFGMADILQKGLSALKDRIRVSFIYGSMATGEETAESDIDLMVVGDEVSVGQIVSALSDSQYQLQREVNPSVYHTEEFCYKLADGNHFISSVVKGPKIFLIGDECELKKLAEIGVGQKAPNKSKRDRKPVRPGGS